MVGSRRWRRRALAASIAALVAGCSAAGDDAPDASIEPLPSLTFDVTTVASTAAPPSTAPVTAGATASLAPSTAPVTQPPEPAVTTTTEPIALQELILTGDGIGSAQFGADPDQVVEYVTSLLGGSTADTGWVDPSSFAECTGSVARRVDWGVLTLLFTDLSPIANGRPHFIGYEYGRVGQIGDDPVGLHTPGGIALGSRVVDLLAEFPEATINPGQPEVDIPDNFYVSTVFYGLLTGTTLDDYVTVLFGGYGCFE